MTTTIYRNPQSRRFLRCTRSTGGPVKPRKKRVATTLNRAEQRAFARVRKYVRSYCGPVSDAEVLRFLVRNWMGP